MVNSTKSVLGPDGVNIVLDAMGGDNAPWANVAGAVEAAKDADYVITLVGDVSAIERALERYGGKPDNIEITSASQVITMEDKPVAALRSKRDASIVVGAQLVKDGHAQGLVSAGNTGATLVVSKMILGCLPGVERPALTTVMPSEAGKFVLVDAGANVDCKPHHLVQFATMASVFCKHALHVQFPKIGLLNIGEEEAKGNEQTKRAHTLLKESGLDFVGNIEGREVFDGKVDVVVCDGFVGNVVLKLSEGVAFLLARIIKRYIMSRWWIHRMLLYVLGRSVFRHMRDRTNYEEYGGAPFLGINGSCIVAHGGSSPRAICSALTMAADVVRSQVNAKILEELGRVTPTEESALP